MPTTQHDYGPQDQINEGQRKINFALTEADKKLIEVLKMVKNAIQAPPGQMHTYVGQIDAAIKEATEAIEHVAELRPPGCDPVNTRVRITTPTSEQNPESFLRVARSLNLEGPPDWSSRLDDYLYGGNETIHE